MIADSMDPAVVALISAPPSGVVFAASASADSLEIGSGYETVSESARLRDRRGHDRSSSEQVLLDLGTDAGSSAAADGIVTDLEAIGFAAVHLLNLAGARGGPSYASSEHFDHGGASRAAGARRSGALARLAIGQVTGDAPQESAIAATDAVIAGSQVLPRMLELAGSALIGDGITSGQVHPRARDLAPALWPVIHGPWSAAGRVVAPLVGAALESSPWHLGNPKWPGITSSELSRFLCFTIAAVASSGLVPIHALPLELAAFRLPASDGSVRFARKVHAAITDWLAPYIRDGWSEQALSPLGSDFSGAFSHAFGGRRTASNPCAPLAKVDPAIASRILPPGMAGYRKPGQFSSAFAKSFRRGPETPASGWGALFRSFEVPQVLSAVFRHGETNDLCLALFGWQDGEGAFSGTFEPWRYASWGGNFSSAFSRAFASTRRFSVYRMRSGESDFSSAFSGAFGGPPGLELIASGLRGRLTVQAYGTAGTVSSIGSTTLLQLGAVPAQSVVAYVFRQE